MKNIFSTFPVLIIVLGVVSCEINENPVDPASSFFSISVPGGTDIEVQANTTVDIDVDIRSSGGITSLTADGNAVTLASGNIQTVTYMYNVPDDTVGAEYSILFAASGSGASGEVTVTATITE